MSSLPTSADASPSDSAGGAQGHAAELVSVIVPTYNRAGLIGETLDSVAQQTHRPIELLIADDGSTDRTAAMVERWRRRREGVGLRLFYDRRPWAGAPAARNRALRAASGRYIQFLDSDDLLLPTKLERSLAALRETNASVVVMDAQRFFTDQGARRPPTRFSQRQPKRLAIHARKGLMNTPTALYRREAIEQLGLWREDLAAWQDFEFISRIFMRQLPTIWLDEVGVLIRNTPGSIIRRPPETVYRSYIRACRAIEQGAAASDLLNADLRNALGRRLMKRATLAIESGATTAGRRLYRAALPRLNRWRRYEAAMWYHIACAQYRRSLRAHAADPARAPLAGRG